MKKFLNVIPAHTSADFPQNIVDTFICYHKSIEILFHLQLRSVYFVLEIRLPQEYRSSNLVSIVHTIEYILYLFS